MGKTKGWSYLGTRTVVSVMADDLPIKKNVFHLRATPDVMDDHIISAPAWLVYDDTNMGDPAA
jgi:hypothetical protein